MVGRLWSNFYAWGYSGARILTIFVSYVDPHFPNILYFDIWGYMKVYNGIWGYLKVYKGIERYMKVYKGI